MIRDGFSSEVEESFRNTLAQLYTLAYYAFGDSGVAQDSIVLVLDAFESSPGRVNAQELFRLGVKVLYQQGLQLDYPLPFSEHTYKDQTVLGRLSVLSFEKRLSLLLLARHGMPLSSLALETN